MLKVTHAEFFGVLEFGGNISVQRGRYDTAWHQQERVEAAEATGIALSIHPAVLAWFLR